MPSIAAADGMWFEAGFRLETLTLDSGLTFECAGATNDLCTSGLNGVHMGSVLGGSAGFVLSDEVWSVGLRLGIGQGSFEPESQNDPAQDPLKFYLVALELPIEARTTFDDIEAFLQITIRTSSFWVVDDSDTHTENALGGVLSVGLRFYGLGVSAGAVAGALVNGSSGELTYRIRLDDEPSARPARRRVAPPVRRRVAPPTPASAPPTPSRPQVVDEPAAPVPESPQPSSPSQPSAPSDP